MKPTTTEVLPLVVAVYQRHSGGCCLHIVLDDNNVTDSDVDFCVKRSHENGHADCLELAERLRAMSRTQRLKLAKVKL